MNGRMIKNIGLALVLMPLLLTSCQVVKFYKSPEVDADGLFRGESPTDTLTIADIPWREYFPDTLLLGLIDEGLKNNFDLQIAVTRIQQAEAGLGMARAAYFPNLALAGQLEHSRTSGTSSSDLLKHHSNQYALGVAATWELDIWGKLNRQSRAKHAQFLASHSYRNLVQTSLIANIATSYYSLLALDEQLKITTETAGLMQESARTMQELMNAGMLNGAAVEQSKALLYGTRTNIPALESQIRQLENSLSLLLGRKPGEIERASIDAQAVPAELKYGVPMQMLARRPDVEQAELAFRSAFEMTNAARASFYPSITLSSGSMIGFGSNVLSNFFKPEHLFANIIGGLTQPLFARNQLRGNLKIAKAQQEEALLAFEKTVLTAGKEVSDVLYTYESSLRKNESRTQQVEALKTAVYYTQELLKAGEANYTEVLNAEQSLLQAQLGQVSDKLEQLQAAVNLYRALGGGVE